ncbi:hypothetical protein AVEN_269368-1 [Araneus ventricosus]|uniref:Uncharacterized protein n=1 Tax=Araneus ventricosus TaxID=182803 RepID=A0A4Y2LL16_ARAVE|nr:hypothetical protein AVEN_269368-1 [Araneus ventricosus]
MLPTCFGRRVLWITLEGVFPSFTHEVQALTFVVRYDYNKSTNSFHSDDAGLSRFNIRSEMNPLGSHITWPLKLGIHLKASYAIYPKPYPF